MSNIYLKYIFRGQWALIFGLHIILWATLGEMGVGRATLEEMGVGWPLNNFGLYWQGRQRRQLGRTCYRIILRQSENFSFFQSFSQIAFRIVPLPDPKRVMQLALALPSLSHTCFVFNFEHDNSLQTPPRFAVFLTCPMSPDPHGNKNVEIKA